MQAIRSPSGAYTRRGTAACFPHRMYPLIRPKMPAFSKLRKHDSAALSHYPWMRLGVVSFSSYDQMDNLDSEGPVYSGGLGPKTLQYVFSSASQTLIVLRVVQIGLVVPERMFGPEGCTTAPAAPPVVQDRMRERTVRSERIKRGCTTVRVQESG